MSIQQKELVKTPLTGPEYLESLKDGREVWIHGERVKDVTAHPAFRNSARSIARLYDALHDEKTKDILTVKTDTGNGGYTQKFFQVDKSAQDLLKSRDAIAEWAKLSYGQMGRSPDYKAGFLTTLGADPDYYGEYADNARKWYKEAQEKNWFFNHAIINPPVDRNKPLEAVQDIFIKAVGETKDGVIVSGAKMVATGSALTNYNFVANYGAAPITKEEMALCFVASMDTPGVKLVCRASYEMNAAVMGSPYDYPLSSRFDENDAVLIFDEALIPWENIFIYKDVNKINSFFKDSGFLNRFTFHGLTRLAVKLDFIAGLLLKAVKINGTDSFRGVQTNVGEVLAWKNMFWAMSDAMALNPDQGRNGSVLPNLNYGMAYRVFMSEGWPKIKEIIENVVAGSLIVQPSSVRDWNNPDLRPYLDKLYRGSDGVEAVDKIKLIKLLWDVVGTEYGGRHELYERNYSGNHENIRLENVIVANENGDAERFEKFVDECMSDYDLNGWTNDTWINPDDVSYFSK
ncbi:4-hydroxyphenylacetate 3-hydroxylase N-terminal domain-containing protein [Priestia megaterium]|jgi:4-hydroxyphenylacetate 3-monooxygenase|uniref:4-hydroxyphenylacetate 3-hydroxylase N-terminal domain-containing protein n=1 Tax=Priestia aryabhattai TaxID=412384 RepID=A0ABD7X373_PRIAR|nr:MULTISPECIES: 4-hydroxyphenylacetate 3-hydroxylase N-terminal domain-containing protein [Priestia]AYE53841.1 Pyoverdin chromophore biosynthetic protein pvcC [Priestia megaterium NCT-2]MBU3568735.1 Pyoverdin chromophore biosynthetic protein pvcC [Priestia aryabhattai]MDI3089672.1 4-hydroxyphenylacetate 3-hydroxylase N-terminal domain-containing protein [Priestia megaterium]WEA47100.1 4-hydroxyphenylacetate 3-hydroxylase N-terminal domain-containing protein [Priestia aryabhattai]